MRWFPFPLAPALAGRVDLMVQPASPTTAGASLTSSVPVFGFSLKCLISRVHDVTFGQDEGPAEHIVLNF